MRDRLDLSTLVANHAIASNTECGAVVPPLYLSTTYEQQRLGEKGPYDYGRTNNPNRQTLAALLAKLEGGAGAVVTSSGMAALDLVLALLEPHDVVLAPQDCYAGTYRLLNARAKKNHFKVQFCDFYRKDFFETLTVTPNLILIETPTNPLLRVIDIERCAALARNAGAWLAVDNTFLSPVLQNPLAQGADFAVHSTTKFINGHTDMVGGAVVCKDIALHAQLGWWANCVGTTGSPFDSFLTLRGLRTLCVRVEQQQKTTQALAERLAAHDAVEAVHYPGLPSHPDYALAQRQQRGPGALLSFDVKGGFARVAVLMERLTLITCAQSLGGTESLISHPATMTHAAMPADARQRAGIGEGLVRLSVGLESAQDLWDDLRQALA